MFGTHTGPYFFFPLRKSGLQIRIHIILGSRIRIRIRVKSWIRIRIRIKVIWYVPGS
jgi:hypothetical protein